MRAVVRLEAILRDSVVHHDEYTHASMGLRPFAGKFHIPSSRHDEFMAAYGGALEDGHLGAYALVERHRHIGPVVIDIDLRTHSPERPYAATTVDAFVGRLFAELGRLVVFEASEASERIKGIRGIQGIRCFLLEKPAPRACSQGTFKDGFHLVVPDVVTRPELQVTFSLPSEGAGARRALGGPPPQRSPRQAKA